MNRTPWHDNTLPMSLVEVEKYVQRGCYAAIAGLSLPILMCFVADVMMYLWRHVVRDVTEESILVFKGRGWMRRHLKAAVQRNMQRVMREERVPKTWREYVASRWGGDFRVELMTVDSHLKKCS